MVNSYKFKNEFLYKVYSLLSLIDYNVYKPNSQDDRLLWWNCHFGLCANTIKTIDFCVGEVLISDAFMLLRKYRDTYMQYLYIYKSTDCNENKKEILKWVNFGKTKVKWNHDYSKYVLYLKEEKVINDLFSNHFKDLKENNKLLNDYTHLNGALILYKEYQNTSKTIMRIVDLVKYYTNLLISIIIVFHADALASTDYLDSLELGLQPIEGSQYWVPQFVNEYLKQYFDEELIEYVIKNKRFEMEILL